MSEYVFSPEEIAAASVMRRLVAEKWTYGSEFEESWATVGFDLHLARALKEAGLLAELPGNCLWCNHTWADHHEDGLDQPGTACAVVIGDRACPCPGHIPEPDL